MGELMQCQNCLDFPPNPHSSRLVEKNVHQDAMINIDLQHRFYQIPLNYLVPLHSLIFLFLTLA